MHREAENGDKVGNVENLQHGLAGRGKSACRNLGESFSYNTDYSKLVIRNEDAGTEHADGSDRKG